jgi:hypothetical protein
LRQSLANLDVTDATSLSSMDDLDDVFSDGPPRHLHLVVKPPDGKCEWLVESNMTDFSFPPYSPVTSSSLPLSPTVECVFDFAPCFRYCFSIRPPLHRCSGSVKRAPSPYPSDNVKRSKTDVPLASRSSLEDLESPRPTSTIIS